MTRPFKKRTEKLVARAQAGDAAAFETLVGELAPSLYRTCLGCMGGHEADAADAVQDALVSAWRSIGHLQNPAHFKTWLIRICINACRDLQRRKRPDTTLEAAPEERLADPRTAEVALASDAGFLALVAAAGPANAPIIALFYGEGYATEEIAELLDLSPATVRQRLSRGRKAIAAALGQEDGQPAATPHTAPPSHPRRPSDQPRAPSRYDLTASDCPPLSL